MHSKLLLQNTASTNVRVTALPWQHSVKHTEKTCSDAASVRHVAWRHVEEAAKRHDLRRLQQLAAAATRRRVAEEAGANTQRAKYTA